MTEITVRLADEILARLRVRADREGVSIVELIEREAARLADQDPFAFFEIGSSDDLRGAEFRAQLGEAGFGDR